MDNALGYIAYILICSTGAAQLLSMVTGRNIKYSIWTAAILESGLVLLQFSLFRTGAPQYVVVGNFVSTIFNSGCFAWLIWKHWPTLYILSSAGLLDHDPELEGAGGNTFVGPSENSITLPAPEHDHPSYGSRNGELYWEPTQGCPACGRALFDETQMREV